MMNLSHLSDDEIMQGAGISSLSNDAILKGAGIRGTEQPKKGGLAPYVHGLMKELTPQVREQGLNDLGKVLYGIGSAITPLANVDSQLSMQAPHRAQLPEVPENMKDIPYNVGEAIGNVGQFITGGAGLNAIRGAAETLPGLIGKGAQYLGRQNLAPTAIRQGLGTAAYDASQSPQDILGGAEEGAAYGAGGALIPGVAGKAVRKGLDLFKPNKFEPEIAQNIAQQILKEVPKQHHTYKTQAGDLYSSVKKDLGDTRIFPKGKGGFESTNFGQQKRDYIVSPQIEEIYESYKQNPNLSNLHDLKIQYGKDIRNLEKEKEKSGLTVPENKGLREAENNIKAIDKDIQDFLQRNDLEAAKKFKEADIIWKTKVAPYEQIRNKLKGASPTPQNILNALDFMERKQGKFKKGEWVSSFPQEARTSTEKLREGLMTENKMREEFAQREAKKDYTARKIAAAASGALLGGLTGLPYYGGQILGGGVGALLASPEGLPSLPNFGQKQIGKALKPVGGMSGLIRQAILANVLAGNNQ